MAIIIPSLYLRFLCTWMLGLVMRLVLDNRTQANVNQAETWALQSHGQPSWVTSHHLTPSWSQNHRSQVSISWDSSDQHKCEQIKWLCFNPLGFEVVCCVVKANLIVYKANTYTLQKFWKIFKNQKNKNHPQSQYSKVVITYWRTHFNVVI